MGAAAGVNYVSFCDCYLTQACSFSLGVAADLG